MNIVIGGASGAMRPILGWAATLTTMFRQGPLIMFLIIFVWTPPTLLGASICIAAGGVWRKGRHANRCRSPMVKRLHCRIFCCTPLS